VSVRIRIGARKEHSARLSDERYMLDNDWTGRDYQPLRRQKVETFRISEFLV
jgi:hypothetical protein